MRKYLVSFHYEETFEAEDSADALMKAEDDFNIYYLANVEEIEEEESGDKEV